MVFFGFLKISCYFCHLRKDILIPGKKQEYQKILRKRSQPLNNFLRFGDFAGFDTAGADEDCLDGALEVDFDSLEIRYEAA